MEFRTGQFYDGNDGDPSTCGPLGRSCNAIGGRAPGFTFAGNAGLPLGPEGFLNLSLEYGGTQPTNRAVQDGGTLAVINGGNSNVRDTSRAWGTPLVDDDLKMFRQLRHRRGESRVLRPRELRQQEGDRRVLLPQPETTAAACTPLTAVTRCLSATCCWRNGMGSANCPTVNIVNGTPDPVAFGAVRDDPNCFTFHEPFVGAPDGFPGGFTPQFGGNLRDASVVAGGTRHHDARAQLGRQRQHGPEPHPDLHLRYGQRLARSRTARPASNRTCWCRRKRASTPTCHTRPAT